MADGGRIGFKDRGYVKMTPQKELQLMQRFRCS